MTTKVRVRKAVGDSITIAYDGDLDDAVTYKVTDGQVTVRDEHLFRFLAIVEGSAVVGGAAATPAPEV